MRGQFWPLAWRAENTELRGGVFSRLPLIYASSAAEPRVPFSPFFLPSSSRSPPLPPPVSISFISLLIGILPFAPVSLHFPLWLFFFFLFGPLSSTPKASRGLKMLLTLVRHLGPSGECEKGCETETVAPHSTAAFPSATAPRSEVIGLRFLSLLLLLSDRSILIASSHCGLLE